jgi:hypothetical protein
MANISTSARKQLPVHYKLLASMNSTSSIEKPGHRMPRLSCSCTGFPPRPTCFGI